MSTISFQILYTIKITRKNNSKYKIKILLADDNSQKYIHIYLRIDLNNRY